jgi:hypothetical protein
MKVGLGVLGFVGLMVALFFAAVPAAKVDAAIRDSKQSAYADQQFVPYIDGGMKDPGKIVGSKSGLRVAVEGRLRWLGLL